MEGGHQRCFIGKAGSHNCISLVHKAPVTCRDMWQLFAIFFTYSFIAHISINLLALLSWSLLRARTHPHMTFCSDVDTCLYDDVLKSVVKGTATVVLARLLWLSTARFIIELLSAHENEPVAEAAPTEAALRPLRDVPDRAVAG